MLNKKLEKQIDYYRGKCYEYHNRMKFANPFEMTKYERQYRKHNDKYNEIQKIIESDGKHKVIFLMGGEVRIDEVKEEVKV